MTQTTALEKARLHGNRLTTQRKLIYAIVSRSGGHLDADQIYREAKKASPRISLSTVYRALARFKEMGLIAEQHLGQEHHHYETGPAPHHHFICRQCGLVIEFEFPVLRHIRKNVPGLQGFEIMGAEVNMHGLCRRCRK